MTEWRIVPSFPDYEASDVGQVRRRYAVPKGKRQGESLAAFQEKNGYLRVTLWIAGAPVKKAIHQLVCEAFHGRSPTERHQAAHGDGIPTNNFSGNLRWATVSENHHDKHRHGTMPIGETCPNAKLKTEQVHEIRALYAQGARQAYLAAKFGVIQAHISRIIRREVWGHI